MKRITGFSGHNFCKHVGNIYLVLVYSENYSSHVFRMVQKVQIKSKRASSDIFKIKD